MYIYIYDGIHEFQELQLWIEMIVNDTRSF